jgi:hypothetical protein
LLLSSLSLVSCFMSSATVVFFHTMRALHCVDWRKRRQHANCHACWDILRRPMSEARPLTLRLRIIQMRLPTCACSASLEDGARPIIKLAPASMRLAHDTGEAQQSWGAADQDAPYHASALQLMQQRWRRHGLGYRGTR